MVLRVYGWGANSMSIETSGSGLWLIIAGMALVTLVTRWGGLFVMSFIPISHRVKLFIQGMSGSVLVAILAPIAFTGDWPARMALLTTLVLMLWFNKPLPAIAGGILAAALLRQF